MKKKMEKSEEQSAPKATIVLISIIVGIFVTITGGFFTIYSSVVTGNNEGKADRKAIVETIATLSERVAKLEGCFTEFKEYLPEKIELETGKQLKSLGFGYEESLPYLQALEYEELTTNIP